MIGKIIMWATCFGCGILFFAIGIYAKNLKKPMWFYSGSEIDPKDISDVEQYNKENGNMWKLYSLWYFAAGIAEIWNSNLSLLCMLLGCSLGVVILVVTYKKIYNRYKVE